MRLQQRAYSQLTSNEDIPEKYRRSVDSQLDEMKKAARGKVVLMICDDVCKCSCYLYHAKFVMSSCRGYRVCERLLLCRSRKQLKDAADNQDKGSHRERHRGGA